MNKTIEVKTNQRLVVMNIYGEVHTVCDMNPVGRKCNGPTATVTVSEREKAFIVDFNGKSVSAVQVSGDIDGTPVKNRYVYEFDSDGCGFWNPAYVQSYLDAAVARGAHILTLPKIVRYIPKADAGESEEFPLFVANPDRGYYKRVGEGYEIHLPVADVETGEAVITYEKIPVTHRRVSDDLVQLLPA
jgi:hypothetical protein